MITCVCMNPAMDKTIELDEFVYGGMNRIKKAVYDPSGKAVNVAIVLRRLGCEVQLVGLNYTEGGRSVADRLKREDIPSDFLWLDGTLRVNIKALDRKTGIITEINDSGDRVPEDTAAKAIAAVDNWSRGSRYVVLTGSTPPGIGPGFYRETIERLGEGRRCFLDCDSKRLEEGIKAHPFLIKPNKSELEMLVGREVSSTADAARIAGELVTAGVTYVCVSLGGEGAMLVGKEGCLFAGNLDLPVRSTVGAGDSLVAGLLLGFDAGLDAAGALRCGVACGNASVMTEGTGLVNKPDYDAILPRISVQNMTF